MRLYSYKMTHDSGFAPNPFGKTLTLATCKSHVRRNSNVGEGTWIAGFSSVGLNGDAVGSERLVFLMEVGRKLLFEDYYQDPQFKDKIPDLSVKSPIARAGDNIYEPILDPPTDFTHFRQIKNLNHWNVQLDKPEMGCQQDDIFGKYVLIAKTFYYFGREPVVIPVEVRPSVPDGVARYGRKTEGRRADDFIAYIQRKYKKGRLHSPHTFDADETTCNSCAPKPTRKTPKTTCAPPNQNPARRAATQSH
ncbi:hypothetical protein ONV78_22845 [Hahella sp. CR1]|uniref:Nmad2 family putative nucleotide modification protein n=1 Tax=Hahella sp. CR1 TaxID=2992807 RepID=UPI00244350FC|nr:hypothetical protein [Hahella sp. CR1]MDG9670594.1 hypothetical protein [Hahella sp. CR1]